MTAYMCRLVLFMISLCWSSELHPASENPETLDDSTNQRGEAIAVQEKPSCATWYWAAKNNGVTRCVCGAAFEHVVVCDEDIHNRL